MKCKTLCVVASLLLFGARPQEARGSGVVGTPDEASLRAALSGGGLVTFNCDGRITLANTLTITSDTTLDATGHSITLSGGGMVSVILVQSPARFVLKNVTVADGAASAGAGIFNYSDTTIINCTFSNNIASGAGSFGGAIYQYSSKKLTVVDSTFIRNVAGSLGGALSWAEPQGPGAGGIEVTNCTFFANGGTAVGIGEPLEVPADFVNCTFAWNTNGAISHDTFAYPTAAPVNLLNSIVAYTVGGLGARNVVDLGYNICSDGSAMTNVTSRNNLDPLLGPLADNGGPSLTVGLFDGSPALDAIPPTQAPTTDQRGVTRPVGPQSDIGAFEGVVEAFGTSSFRFVTNAYFVNEAEGSATIQVERTGTSRGNVTVGFIATNGTATAGLDFMPTNVTLTFADSEMEKVVPVFVFDDQTVESNETVLLNLQDPVGAGLGTPNNATLTIIDNEKAQTLTNLDDASLRAALANGGIIQFAVGGSVLLTNTLMVSGFTLIDAGDHGVVLDGAGAFQIFHIMSGASLTLKGLTLANGLAMGVTPAPGVTGNDGTGGALEIDGGTVNLVNCGFFTNLALGSAGALGTTTFNGTTGGAGKGGAIFLNAGTLSATYCRFQGNVAQGGIGGDASSIALQPGTGGAGLGGAIYNLGGQVSLTNCSFLSNIAAGGDGGKGNTTSNGGDSSGGCLFSTSGQLIVQNSLAEDNQSLSGNGLRQGTAGGPSGLASGGAVEVGGGTNLFLTTIFRANTSVAPWRTPARGGAISQLGGSLIIGDSVLDQNSVLGGNGPGIASPYGLPAAPGLGGALFLGSVTAQITNSAVVQNVARGGSQIFGGSPGAGMGGGLYNLGSNVFVNVTFAGNRSVAGDNNGTGIQGGAFGGGLYNAGGMLTLEHQTVAGNVVEPDATNIVSSAGPLALGAGIFATNGVVNLLNSILANNSLGSNLFGAVVDDGHNLSSDSSCDFTNTGSFINIDPKLGVLDNYGGPTPCMPLLSGSPAIDGADTANFAPTDQRGRLRPFGPAPDIGAFESSPPYVIRGAISSSTFTGEVQVAAGALSVTTTNHGHYSFDNLTNGTYLVAPQSTDYLFVPSNRLEVVGPDRLDVNFKAYQWNALSLESTANRTLDLVFAGAQGKTYRLLESANMVDWTALATNTVGQSNYFETLTPMNGSGSHFLRVVTP